MIPRLSFYYPGTDWRTATVGYAHWHIERLGPLLAERQLDSAQVAMLPNLSNEGRISWYRQVRRSAARALDQQISSEQVTFNGRVLRSAKALKRTFSRTFGALFGTGVR